ncbi:MAG: hypothetical protein KatS3mg005_3207 [Bryobacteraceae bacterium]|nr:MAG: hypothetical protein KatS3mg005_3207 [Bryobacteraceae bacterium]
MEQRRTADGEVMERTFTPVFQPGMSAILQVFLYLQLLDFLTTILGFRLGLSEASPFVRMLTQMGPALGVALSKLIAVSLAAACLLLNRARVLKWINYWYAALVLWNLSLMVLAGTGR